MELFQKNAFIQFMVENEILSFGEFKLKSGRIAPYFINTGRYKDGRMLKYLSLLFAEEIMNHIPLRMLSCVYGHAYKGISLAVGTALYLQEVSDSFSSNQGENTPVINFCFNRKEEKDHGDRGSLVGYQIQHGDRVVIVEDVTTSGDSIIEAANLIAAYGAEVSGVFISVDRQEVGKNTALTAKTQIEKELGIPVYALVNVADIVNYLKLQDNPNDEQIVSIEMYIQAYGGKEE